jgi:hypothetical protein
MERLPGKLVIRTRWGLVLLVFGAFAVLLWYITTTNDRERRANVEAARQKVFSERAQARVTEWATVIKEKELTPGETLRLIDVPDQSFGFLSTRCMIYTNAIYRTAQFVCPGTTEVGQ